MDLREVLKRLCFPPVWMTTILSVISAVGLALVFVRKVIAEPLSYAVYAVAFYTLCVLAAFFVAVVPERFRDIRKIMCRHQMWGRYMTDPAFKTRVKLHSSLTVNLLYVSVNILS